MLSLFPRAEWPEAAGQAPAELIPCKSVPGYPVIVIDTSPVDVLEPDAVYVPLRLESGRRPALPGRIRKAALAMLAASVLMTVASGTWASAERAAMPVLPAPPAVLGAAGGVPATPLHTTELRVVDSLSGLTTNPGFGSPAQFVRVMLLRTEDRMSLALEMSAEPASAALRALSPTAFELEVGPVIGPIRAAGFAASDVPLINRVSVREITAGDRSYVRTRIMLNAPGRGDVRVVGRLVYVDLAPFD
jgi:hypothetical protein